MSSRYALAACVGLMALCPLQTKGDAQTQEKPIVQIPQAGVPQILDDGGQVRPGLVQQRRLCDPRIPGLQPFGRRGMDAPRGRHDGARQRAGLQVDP